MENRNHQGVNLLRRKQASYQWNILQIAKYLVTNSTRRQSKENNRQNYNIIKLSPQRSANEYGSVQVRIQNQPVRNALEYFDPLRTHKYYTHTHTAWSACPPRVLVNPTQASINLRTGRNHTYGIGMNIVFWNCQGLRPKRKELQNYLLENQIDILALNETFLKPKFKFHLPGYDIYKNDRLAGTKGGVAILVKKASL